MDGGAATTHAVPDSHGLNLYRADPALARLAALYLELCWNLGDAVIRRRSVLAC